MNQSVKLQQKLIRSNKCIIFVQNLNQTILFADWMTPPILQQ